MQNYKSKFKIIIALIIYFVLIPGVTSAAILYFEPSSGEYRQGDTFIVEARIDTEEECINTIEANLSFSQDVLTATDFSQGNSILTIWLENPKINQNEGLISFSGGIPGGYCGILPGEPGEPDLLGKIVLKAKEVSREQFSVISFLESSQVLLNDGFGTPAKLTTKEAIFTILLEKAEVPKEEWKEEIKKDNIPPEPFEIEIHQDPAIFEGKYFIVFQTQDKQTGLDHYEVLESRKQKIENRNWETVESPYLLKDQTLQSIIKVKAVDKAGNERIAEYIPPKKPFPYWIIIIILVGIGIGYYLWRKRRTVLRQ